MTSSRRHHHHEPAIDRPIRRISRGYADPTGLLLLLGLVLVGVCLSVFWLIDAYRECTASGLSWSTCLWRGIK